MSTKRKRPDYTPMSGIAAVLGTTKREESTEASARTSIDLIHSRSNQPRRYFDPVKLKDLTHSIKEHGVLEPILVRPLSDGGKYEIIAGERRFRAAKEAGLTEIPTIVLDIGEEEALKLALVENLQREDLNPVEETEGMLDLLSSELGKSRKELINLFVQAGHPDRNGAGKNVFPTDDWGKIEGLFRSIGRLTPDSFRTARLPLLNMPQEVLDAVRQGKLQYTKAREIAKIKDEGERQTLLEDAITEGLSLTEIKTRSRSLKEDAKVRDGGGTQTLKAEISDAFGSLKKDRRIWTNPSPKIKKKLERIKALIEEVRAEAQEDG